MAKKFWTARMWVEADESVTDEQIEKVIELRIDCLLEEHDELPRKQRDLDITNITLRAGWE